MAQTGRRTGPSLRVLVGAAGVLALFGPVLVVLGVWWAVSLTWALAAGLMVSLLLTLVLLAGGWRLLHQVQREDLTPPAPRGDLTPSPSPTNYWAPRLRRIPVSARRGETCQAISPRTKEGASGAELPRILLVEDDPVTQRIVARLLRQLGVQTDVVGDGQAALDAVAANRHALVLMDCQLPVLDGYAATAQIRQREAAAPGSSRLPIVALTATALDADRQRALAAGMDDLLTKPLDLARLAALLADWGLRQEPSKDQPSEVRADGPPVLDPAGLPTVNGRLREPYREIAQLYRQEAVRRMADMEAAARLLDRPQVAKIAHTLAGSSSSIGALRMAAACAALEALAKGPGTPAPARPSPPDRADDSHAHGDDALAGAVEGVRRELEQLDAALAHLTAERPAV